MKLKLIQYITFLYAREAVAVIYI